VSELSRLLKRCQTVSAQIGSGPSSRGR